MEFSARVNKRGRRGWPKGLFDQEHQSDLVVSEGTLIPLQEGVDMVIGQNVSFTVQQESENSVIINPMPIPIEQAPPPEVY